MTDEQLVVLFGLEVCAAEKFRLKLAAIRRNWPEVIEAELPNRKDLKRHWEQYFASVEKTLKLARKLPPGSLHIKSQPNSEFDEEVSVFDGRAPVRQSSTAATAWLRHPPDPIEYLEYLMRSRLDVPATLRDREANPEASLVYKEVDDLLPNVPRKDVYPRNWLLNNLLDLFGIVYPQQKPTLYSDEAKGGYGGSFYVFLREVLPTIDANPDLPAKLAYRFKERF
ncbi:MAG: hypothetical protein ABJ084_03895 [Halioglobus sp.]